MSKIRIFTFIILPLLLLVTLTRVKLVDAANIELCPGPIQTSPSPLLSNSDSATFTIPVNNTAGVTGWKVEFNCGLITHQTVDATIDPNSSSIIASITRNKLPGAGCEFFSGAQTILVKAVINGSDRNWCTGSYRVIDSDSQCKLTISPTTGITPTTEVKVSGTNLTEGGYFRLFIDNDNLIPLTGVPITGGLVPLRTPDFSDIKIPVDYITLGTHTLSLKRAYSFPGLPGLPPIIRDGPPLCSKSFNVGNTTSPGVVGTTVIALAGGQKATGCNDNTSNPGIATAVGCIHTNPAEFVKDFLTFAIGISGGLAFLMMLLGAFQMLTSAGNPETLKAGQDRLTSAIIGLLFVIFAVLLLQIIGVSILGIPGFGK